MGRDHNYPKSGEKRAPNTSSMPSSNHTSRSHPESHRDVRVYDDKGEQSDKLHITPSK